MKILEAKNTKTVGAALLFILMCVPLVARAETDRLTVEDPTTGAVMFKVTSAGNVTGGSITASGNILSGPNPPAYNIATVNDGGAAVFGARSYGIPPTNRSVFLLDRSGGSLATPSLLNDGDWIGSVQANAYSGSIGFYASAGINFLVDGPPTINQRTPGRIVFMTAPNGGAFTERMTVKNDGTVGIGTSTPTQMLEVAGGVRLNTTAVRPACSATNRGTVWFTQGAGSANDSLAVCSQFGGAYTWKVVF